MSTDGLVPPSAGEGGASPQDFRDEVARELRACYRELAGDRARLSALEELERMTLELAAELRRPLTVFDVVRSAPTAAERERRRALVRSLRGGG
jgi:hypothetical protein